MPGCVRSHRGAEGGNLQRKQEVDRQQVIVDASAASIC